MSNNSIVLTEKEANDFNNKKTESFRGTMVLSGVYAMIAIILLILINFTSFGKEYIYNKLMPFVLTYVLGAIFIIIYLVISIYNLEPSKERRVPANDIICPDYWKLKELSDEEISIIKQNKGITSNIIDDEDLRYKCEIDTNIVPLKNYQTDSKIRGYKQNNLSIDNPNYIYVNYTGNDDSMKTYSQMAGIYNLEGSVFNSINEHSISSNITDKVLSKINGNTLPLICNEVYPKYLSTLDETTKEGNKFRCEYAKQCNIPWNDIGCK